jgi:hypothetical protein
MPDGSVYIGMVSIVLLSGLTFYVWQEQVVPMSRTKLALSKRSGSVKQYLDELSADEIIVARRRRRGTLKDGFSRIDWFREKRNERDGQPRKNRLCPFSKIFKTMNKLLF